MTKNTKTGEVFTKWELVRGLAPLEQREEEKKRRPTNPVAEEGENLYDTRARSHSRQDNIKKGELEG